MQMTQSSEAANNENRFGKQSINLTNNNKIHGGEQLTKDKLNARFSRLTASQLQQFHSEAGRMITMLIDIKTEITKGTSKY